MFSPATGYAAIALGYLADCEEMAAKVEDIAGASKIPPAYLSKIMHTLARKGFVRTRRGVGGGVELTCDPDRVTLLDICRALDDPAIEQRCMLGTHRCSDERNCPAHEFWMTFRQQLLDFAQRTSIKSIGDFERRQQKSRKGKRDQSTSSPKMKSAKSTPKRTKKKRTGKGARDSP